MDDYKGVSVYIGRIHWRQRIGMGQPRTMTQHSPIYSKDFAVNQLVHQLHVRVDEQGQRLLDNTTVVVCSEMDVPRD